MLVEKLPISTSKSILITKSPALNGEKGADINLIIYGIISLIRIDLK